MPDAKFLTSCVDVPIRIDSREVQFLTLAIFQQSLGHDCDCSSNLGQLCEDTVSFTQDGLEEVSGRMVSMVRNRVPSWLVGLLTLAMNTVCASGDKKLRVVTSTTDLASLLQKIGGDRVAVTSLSRGYQDPHFAPVNARSLLKLNRAHLFLVTGLQMEIAWLGEGLGELSPIAQCRNPRIQFGSLGYFDISPYVQVVERADEITRAQGIHPLGNSHYWLTRTMAAEWRRLSPHSSAPCDRMMLRISNNSSHCSVNASPIWNGCGTRRLSSTMGIRWSRIIGPGVIF